MSPYCSMLGNPIRFNDPNGDNPLLIGAAIGVLSNGIGNAINGENFFKGAGQAAFFGAAGGGVSSFIGGATAGITSAGSKAVSQFAAHSVSGGFMSLAQGANFWHGAASGGFASATGSLIGNNATGQWLGSGLSGGVGSAIAGGSFWDGARQGLFTGGLNHAAHKLITDPPWIERMIKERVMEKAGLLKKNMLKQCTKVLLRKVDSC